VQKTLTLIMPPRQQWTMKALCFLAKNIEQALLKRFSTSEVKGLGYSESNALYWHSHTF